MVCVPSMMGAILVPEAVFVVLSGKEDLRLCFTWFDAVTEKVIHRNKY